MNNLLEPQEDFSPTHLMEAKNEKIANNSFDFGDDEMDPELKEAM